MAVKMVSNHEILGSQMQVFSEMVAWSLLGLVNVKEATAGISCASINLGRLILDGVVGVRETLKAPDMYAGEITSI